jgi:hypothetical protein
MMSAHFGTFKSMFGSSHSASSAYQNISILVSRILGYFISLVQFIFAQKIGLMK